MVGRAVPAALALPQGVEKRPQQGGRPALAAAEQRFELRTQLLDRLRADAAVARAEDAVDAVHRLGEA